MFQNLATNLYTFAIVILRKKLMDLLNLTIEYQGKYLNQKKLH
jgi:hypothetical protein